MPHRYAANMLTVSTVNVDRIGPEAQSGFFAWLRDPTSDVVCLQASGTERGRRALQVAEESGWHVAVAAPSDRGGNGAALLSRIEPETTQVGFDAGEFDDSGRYVELTLKDVVIASVHLLPEPVDDAAERERTQFVRGFAVYLGELRARAEAGSKETLLCGSGNLVDRAEDAAAGADYPAPQQRAVLARNFLEAGYVDVVGAVATPEVAAENQRPVHFPNYQVATTGMAQRTVAARTEPFLPGADDSEGVAVTVQYDL